MHHPKPRARQIERTTHLVEHEATEQTHKISRGRGREEIPKSTFGYERQGMKKRLRQIKYPAVLLLHVVVYCNKT